MLKIFKIRCSQNSPLATHYDEEIQRVEQGNNSPRYDTKIITDKNFCVQIHSIPVARNVITNSDLNLEKDKLPLLQEKVFEFKQGHNAHSLFIQWGRIDQLSSRKNRYVRQIILLSHIENTPYIKILISTLYDKIAQIDTQINQVVEEYRNLSEFSV
jgi:hypothetical protein